MATDYAEEARIYLDNAANYLDQGKDSTATMFLRFALVNALIAIAEEDEATMAAARTLGRRSPGLNARVAHWVRIWSAI